MRRLSLSSLLMALNAGLVLVAVVGTAAGAVRVLRQLADRQALARADLAAQSAALAIERAGDRVLASARLLADRPAVGRILSAGDRAGLAAWLERFRRTSDLSGCALFAAETRRWPGRRCGGWILAARCSPTTRAAWSWAARRRSPGRRESRR